MAIFLDSRVLPEKCVKNDFNLFGKAVPTLLSSPIDLENMGSSQRVAVSVAPVRGAPKSE